MLHHLVWLRELENAGRPILAPKPEVVGIGLSRTCQPASIFEQGIERSKRAIGKGEFGRNRDRTGRGTSRTRTQRHDHPIRNDAIGVGGRFQ
ncbi:hypothetical protein [Aureimonas sp. ME7]|uniref:hypothetical protein n=1 Tax=Aureimonas sp. ME7 TaxID=2744252 RepID=UPI0015F57CB6|nr:hypothetical protein [Aureimonas sp. ME7]